jgi:hypothetical protein
VNQECPRRETHSSGKDQKKGSFHFNKQNDLNTK